MDLAATYPGSPTVSVVTGLAEAVTATPAKRSWPEKDVGEVKGGEVPLWLEDGKRATWNAAFAEALGGKSPALQVTVRECES